MPEQVSTEAKPLPKKLPGFSAGKRVNSALRTIKMIQPICPNSKVEMERNEQGDWVPKRGPTNPDRMNCQKRGGKWWEFCEEQGHNPYFREQVWYVTEDEYDEETGIMTGTRRLRRSRIIPNLSQVAVAPHLNSGKGARNAYERKGKRRVTEFGYEDTCQYRNCQEPVNPEFVSRQYGKYCCQEELALVAAEQQGLMLHRPDPGLNGPEEEPKVARARQLQLTQALAFAKDN